MIAGVVAFGLVIGSFLNVVIARVPAGRSIWRPRSACPTCGTRIAWYDNIPLLSFVVLGRRCRQCKTLISWRYPIVESTAAAAFAIAYHRLGLTPDFAVAVVFLSMLIAITGIDLSHRIIPDVITLPGIAIGILANLIVARAGWRESLIGVAVGGGLFFAIIAASGFKGMGGGDMKLGAMLGAFLGWKLGLLAILLAVFGGGSVAVWLLLTGRRGRKDAIPFGPFLAFGGAIAFLWGEELLGWYLGQFAP